jgi:hypothetical protein
MSKLDWRYAKLMETVVLTTCRMSEFLAFDLDGPMTEEKLEELRKKQQYAQKAVKGLNIIFEDVFEMRKGNFSAEVREKKKREWVREMERIL